MIIAGNCLFSEHEEEKVVATAEALKEVATHFRVKIFGGGTKKETYNEGVGLGGVAALKNINKNMLPCGTEVHIPSHVELCQDLSFLWLGARNSRNYTLLKELFENYEGDILLKRGMDMTISEVMDLYDLIVYKYKKRPYIVERGVITFDRLEDSRWSPDLKGIIRLKKEREDIFRRIIIDCSHSAGRKEYIGDIYRAFYAIGCLGFMFECSSDGRSETDKRQMLSVKELKNILEGEK